jgi:hypothetical protein
MVLSLLPANVGREVLMKRRIGVRTVVAALLLSVGLSLSSCVVYEPVPYDHGGGHHDHWR